MLRGGQRLLTHSTANVPGPDELREMSPEEAMLAGAESGGVHVVHRRQRYPIPGTKAEKRAERGVSFMFGLAALAGIAFIVVFVASARCSGRSGSCPRKRRSRSGTTSPRRTRKSS